jgi:hypothetical protein
MPPLRGSPQSRSRTPNLHRAYLLKEGLRLEIRVGSDEIEDALRTWMGWAQRCRIPEFRELSEDYVLLRLPAMGYPTPALKPPTHRTDASNKLAFLLYHVPCNKHLFHGIRFIFE